MTLNRLSIVLYLLYTYLHSLLHTQNVERKVCVQNYADYCVLVCVYVCVCVLAGEATVC